jgi:cytochrome P450
MLGWYGTVNVAFTSFPVPLPGTRYRRGLGAVDEIIAFYVDVVKEHRKSPTGDGLSRILGHTTASGVKLDDDGAARELHHLVIAGRVVYTHLGGTIQHLAQTAASRERLASEIREKAPTGALTLEQLAAMPELDRVNKEVKRIVPVVPGMFGIAKKDFVVMGKRVPKGWGIFFALHATHVCADPYASPASFDPDRFAEGRAEDAKYAHGFCPHGPGKPATSHHCAGTDYATLLAKVFTVALVRGYRFELPEQDLSYDFARLTPDPRDGLRVKVARA